MAEVFKTGNYQGEYGFSSYEDEDFAVKLATSTQLSALQNEFNSFTLTDSAGNSKKYYPAYLNVKKGQSITLGLRVFHNSLSSTSTLSFKYNQTTALTITPILALSPSSFQQTVIKIEMLQDLAADEDVSIEIDGHLVGKFIVCKNDNTLNMNVVCVKVCLCKSPTGTSGISTLNNVTVAMADKWLNQRSLNQALIQANIHPQVIDFDLSTTLSTYPTILPFVQDSSGNPKHSLIWGLHYNIGNNNVDCDAFGKEINDLFKLSAGWTNLPQTIRNNARVLYFVDCFAKSPTSLAKSSGFSSSVNGWSMIMFKAIDTNTVAHECAHLLGARHPWSTDSKNKYPLKSIDVNFDRCDTKNLMDYSLDDPDEVKKPKITLWKWQWEVMRNNPFLTP
ncbi:MAG: hypothetical protein ACKVTZ_10990 [Bacteroidia bacterium]